MADEDKTEVILRVTIEVPPLPKARPRTSSATYAVIGGRRIKTAAAHTYTPAATRAYEEKVAWILRGTGIRPVEGPVAVGVVFHTARQGDIDNYLKAVLDAANGICYRDDRQVEEVVARMERDTPARTDFLLYRRSH